MRAGPRYAAPQCAVCGFGGTLVISSFSSALALLLCSVALSAHDGPPFPILSDHVSGPYTISIWTDPDATEDGTAGGQFWVAIDADRNDAPLPAETRVRIAIRPLDRPATELNAAANPVRGDATNQFAALVMDHEGPFGVRVTVDGPLGPAMAEATVEATYDLRPPAYMIAWYLVPFVVVAALWARLLLARMRSRREASANVLPERRHLRQSAADKAEIADLEDDAEGRTAAC